MQNTPQKNSTENTPQNFPVWKLRIQTSCDDNDDQVFESVWFSNVEKRIQSAIAAAVSYQYAVKIILTYPDGMIRVYQFDTFLK